MPHPTIYFSDDEIEWLRSKCDGANRNKVVRHAVQYYRAHEQEVESWSPDAPSREDRTCPDCGETFDTAHGRKVHQAHCTPDEEVTA